MVQLRFAFFPTDMIFFLQQINIQTATFMVWLRRVQDFRGLAALCFSILIYLWFRDEISHQLSWDLNFIRTEPQLGFGYFNCEWQPQLPLVCIKLRISVNS